MNYESFPCGHYLMMQISLNFVENINQVCNLLWHMTTDYIKICSVTGELIMINLPTHFIETSSISNSPFHCKYYLFL